MNNLYHKKEWQAYRTSCLNLRNNECERCGRTGILQVHHPEYIAGLKPWEYPVDFCEVLCRKCHAEEHGIIRPSDGWIILHSDLEDNEPSDSIECGRCGTDIRWHVTVFHPDWGEMIVGSECADSLSLGEEVRRLKSFRQRLRTYISSPRWKKTNKGFLITYNHHKIFIHDKTGFYVLKIDNKWGEIEYRDLDAAKRQSFTYIESISLHHNK